MSIFLTRAKGYIEDVLSGKELVNKYVRQAVERHVSDLENGHKRGIYFDEDDARLYLDASTLFKHTGGEYAGKPFDLQPFQCFMIYSIFGWKKKKNGKRRFKRVYIETAKKSGKSEIAALIAWLCLLLDNEQGAQVYSVATTRDQALHVFRAAQIMAKYLRQDSHALRRKINVNKIRIYIEESESFFQPLASEYTTLDGINTHIGIVDEYHAHDTSFVSDTIRNSMVVRLQPLHFTITTAGFNLQGPCYRIARAEALQVLSGTVNDDSLFTLIYTLDDDDDWNDPKLWIKANPNIGRTVQMENMIDLYNAAKNGGSTREVDFKTKNLNIWVHSAYNWIPDEVFMNGKMDYSLADQSEREVMCWGGMDLGQTADLTCVAFLFDPDANNGKFIFHLFTWCCDRALEKAHERGYPYMDWQRAGLLDVTPGNVTEYGYIENKLREFRTKHHIVNIGYDRAMAIPTVINLEYDGFAMQQFNQGIMNMNAPTRTLEELFIANSAAHNGNDIMRYMFQNVVIVRDASGNMKITKKDPDKKVDGVVAMVMALGQYMDWKKDNGGLYSDGLKTL
jgi:phage terminase large subunit-like protein